MIAVETPVKPGTKVYLNMAVGQYFRSGRLLLSFARQSAEIPADLTALESRDLQHAIAERLVVLSDLGSKSTQPRPAGIAKRLRDLVAHLDSAATFKAFAKPLGSAMAMLERAQEPMSRVQVLRFLISYEMSHQDRPEFLGEMDKLAEKVPGPSGLVETPLQSVLIDTGRGAAPAPVDDI